MKWILDTGEIIESQRVRNFTIGDSIYSPKYLDLQYRDFLAQHNIYPFIEKSYDTLRYNTVGHTDTLDAQGYMVRTYVVEERSNYLEVVRANKLTDLKATVSQYLQRNFDVDTQISFQALHAAPTTTSEVKDNVKLVWVWIETVLTDYYNRKDLINAATDLETLEKLGTGFDQWGGIKPNVTLESLIRSK